VPGLEPTGAEFAQRVDAAVRRLARHLDELAASPAADVEHAKAAAAPFVEPMPEEGRPLEELLERVFAAVPHSLNTAHPGYLAYIPGGGLPDSAIADLVSATTNRYVGIGFAAPALAQLEATVVRWLCDAVGLPEGAGGFLSSGGSVANLTALVAARRERAGEDLARATVYVSDQAHHSVLRAAMIGGVPLANVRSIESDDAFRVRVDALRERMDADVRAGLRPFLVVANAGTTNTGAVDDMRALAEVARDRGAWFHVDGAYGGAFALTARGRARLPGIERADSVTLDPHKGLFVPYGTGALLVRDVQALRRAMHATADYMHAAREHGEEDAAASFADLSPELSRGFRGLRLWLPLQMHGARAFREMLDEKLELAQWAADELARDARVEMVAWPQLSTFAFRARGEGDERTMRVMQRVNAAKRVHLSGTTLRGRFAIRVSILSFRTHREHVEHALEDIRRALDAEAA